MRKTCFFMLVSCLSLSVCSGKRNSQWKPEYENFWRVAPGKDSFTVVIWPFDRGDDVSVDDIDNLDKVDLDTDGEGLASIQQKIGFKLNGDASNVKGGKFGSCIEFKGKGWISSKDLDFISVFHADNVATIDFWVKPDSLKQNIGRTVLQIGGKKPCLTLQLEAGGKVKLLFDDAPLMTNSRALKAKVWTHICVGLIKNKRERRISPILLVNGLPGKSVDNEKFNKTIDQWQRFNKGSVLIGAGDLGRNGMYGAVDSVRVMKKQPKFYVLEDWSFTDVAKKRQPRTGQPYFVKTLKPITSCSFDKALKPESFSGFGIKQKSGKGTFKPGVRGQAFDLSTLGKESIFELQGMSVIPKDKGTIEFWVRAAGWDNSFIGDFLGTNIPRKTLFKLETDKTPVYLNGYRSVKFLMGRNAQQSKTRYVHFDPGTWTHVLITWDGKKGGGVYLNGLPQPIPEVSFPKAFHPTDKKDYEAWLKRTGGKDDGTYKLRFTKSHTLVDEFNIYDRSFLPTEAWNAYARYFPENYPGKQMKELPWINLGFDYIAHCWDMVQKLIINAACLPIKGVAPAAIDLTIKDRDGKVIADEKDVKLDADGKAVVKILKKFPFGKYPVTVAVKDKDGKVMKTLKTEFERIKPVWYQNQLGKERVVPKPWTPIRIEGNRIFVIGREIVLNKAGLPDQIITDGIKILKAPFTVTATINAQKVDFKPAGDLKFTDKSKDKIRWQGTLKGGNTEILVDVWMEYDGLMYYSLTVKPTGGDISVESLDVDVVMDDKVISQLICNTGGRNFRRSYDIRMIPKGEGSVWNSMNSKPKMVRGVKIGNFCANLWIGGDDVGLNFSAENDKGWTPDDKTAAHEILREDGKVVYRMNVISKPVKVAGTGRTFTYILTPTPTKPEPKGWRAWGRLPKGKPHNANDVIDGFNGFPLTANPDENAPSLSFLLEPYSWESAKIQQEKLHDKFGAENPVYFYIDYSWPKLGDSIREWNHDLYAGTGRMAWIPEVEDYFVWIINEYIKRDLIDGIYIDDTSMGRTYSLASTAYEFPESENKRRIGYNTMGFRRFCQRVYKLFQQHGKYPYILPHMSFCYEIPAFSFATSTVDAEGRDTGLHPGVKFDCMDLWKLDEVRIMGNGKKWGFARNWKPTLNYGIQKMQGKLNPTVANWLHLQSRTMHALIIPHDFWYMWTYPTGVHIHQVFVNFGMDDPDLKFIPYWKLRGQYKIDAPEPDKIISCIFRRPKKALVMVSNLSKKEQKIKITFDAVKLFGRQGKITIKDADIALLIPYPDEVLSEKEKKVELKKGGMDEEISEESLMEELTETKSKAEKSKEKLAMKINGDSAEMLIRRRDFRIMEVKLK